MLYSILIYGSEAAAAGWAPEVEDEMLERHTDLRDELQAAAASAPCCA